VGKRETNLIGLRIIFWALIGIFLLILSMFFIPVVRGLFRGSHFLLLPIIFFLLGGFLIFLTLKKKTKRRLKKFLILTGASASGFFVSVLLHNFLYAVAVLTSQIAVLRFLFEALHSVFFLVAVFICPLGFLIGAVGSGVLFLKKKE